MEQDEDENYIVLSGSARFFNTERDAIDAALATHQAAKGEKT
ncbi:MAG: hypothetical protein Q8N17_26340 [Burkholderiaceae bacterium]|nr:hypothetical protein [Burkholderiaceae bacterium]